MEYPEPLAATLSSPVFYQHQMCRQPMVTAHPCDCDTSWWEAAVQESEGSLWLPGAPLMGSPLVAGFSSPQRRTPGME